MRTFRAWLGPGARLLLRRLEQFRETLDTLKVRLRAAVAEALSQILGSTVRDAVLQLLDRLTDFLPGPLPMPPWHQECYYDDVGGMYEDEDDRDHAALWRDASEYDRERDDDADPASSTPPTRLAVAMSAGLRAASWLLPRRSGRCGLLTTAALALFAAGAAYSAPALAAAGLGLFGATGHLGLLTDTLQFLSMS